MENATVHVEEGANNDQRLYLARLFYLNSLHLNNVTFKGVEQMSAFDHSNNGKKIYARNVFFGDDAETKWETSSDSNELQECSISGCTQDPEATTTTKSTTTQKTTTMKGPGGSATALKTSLPLLLILFTLLPMNF